MRPLRFFLLPVAGALLAAFAATPCHAFERQWHVGLDAGWAGVTWRDSVRTGWGGGAHLTYGLTDAFNAMVELSATSHATDPDVERLNVMSAAAGAAYTLDVVRWVPYMGLLVGGYRFSGGGMDEDQLKVGFQGALGLDYIIDRSWVAGVQLRYHTFSDDPFTAHYMTLFGRFEYVWGW